MNKACLLVVLLSVAGLISNPPATGACRLRSAVCGANVPIVFQVPFVIQHELRQHIGMHAAFVPAD